MALNRNLRSLLSQHTIGTTLLLLATDTFNLYQQVTGATLDQTTGLLTVPDPNTLQSLFFIIGGVSPFPFVVMSLRDRI